MERTEFSDNYLVKATDQFGMAYLQRSVDPKKKNTFRFKILTLNIQIGLRLIEKRQVDDKIYFMHKGVWRYNIETGEKFCDDNQYEPYTSFQAEPGDVVTLIQNKDKLAFMVNETQLGIAFQHPDIRKCETIPYVRIQDKEEGVEVLPGRIDKIKRSFNPKSMAKPIATKKEKSKHCVIF